MLPHVSADENTQPATRKVYINPHFRSQSQSQFQAQARAPTVNVQPPLPYGAPISTPSPAIHINPHFLQRQQLLYKQYQQQQVATTALSVSLPYFQIAALEEPAGHQVTTPAKIISKASTCIVRKVQIKARTAPPKAPVAPTVTQPPLVSKTKRKIIRQSATKAPAPAPPIIPPTPATTSKRTRFKIVRAISLTSSSTPLIKKRRSRDFVGQYALRRSNAVSTSPKSPLVRPSVNKCLRLVSIHGVRYKKTAKNKLTKLEAPTTKPATQQVPTTTPQKPSSLTGRTLFVGGARFVLDPTGCRLTRMPCAPSATHPTTSSSHEVLTATSIATTARTMATRRRIDIGGLTYIASPKALNVFIRTTIHESRAHLMTARQRSLQLLNRSLVKTNIPCAIFQRLGKCAAFSRGKCRKLHDKRQVAICQSFLRGECSKGSECLLSHNVTLEKMPVCRYFLRGVCVREDCPYLHKKLSRKADICIDFLRGFCARAAECDKRHEFVCPEVARQGKCELANCTYCKPTVASNKRAQKTKPKHQPILEKMITATQEEMESATNSTNTLLARYFKCEGEGTAPNLLSNESQSDQEEADEKDASVGDNDTAPPRRRPQLGPLPSFIPLSHSLTSSVSE